MQISRDQRPHSQLCTLESLQSDHASFVADGGDLKAKLHNNVIRPHFFNIPLSQVSKNIQINHEKTLYTHFPLQVCIPSLHVSLGIFYRLFCLFESAVHEVDTLMAYSIAHTSSGHIPPSGSVFEEQVKQLRKIDRLCQEADDLEDEADFYESVSTWSALGEDADDDQIEAMRGEACKARERQKNW